MDLSFFRKYQRAILYGAGLFALVSFSISTEMLQFFSWTFRPKEEMPTMTIGGRQVEVTSEDYAIAQRFASFGQQLGTVLPSLPADARERTRDIWAALRRLAVDAGIDASYDEVDRAIERYKAFLRQVGVPPENVDRQAIAPFGSLPAYRETMREALRVSNFVRVQALAADVTDAALIEGLLEDDEVITLSVATIDKKAIAEELKTADVDDDTVLAWIQGLDIADRRSKGYVDPNRVALRIAMADPAVFRADDWSGELEGVEISDAEVEQFYQTHKNTFFVKPKQDADDKSVDGQENREGSGGNGDAPAPQPVEKPNKDGDGEAATGQQPENADQGAGDPDAPAGEAGPGDPGGQGDGDADADAPAPQEDQFLPLDDARREAIRSRLRAEVVLRKIWRRVQQQQFEALRDLVDARTAALEKKAQADAAVEDAERAVAENASEENEQALAAAEAARDEAVAAHEAAGRAVDDARSAFDVEAAFAAAVDGKPGFTMFQLAGGKALTNEELRETDDLGVWGQSMSAASVQVAGTLSTQTHHVASGVFEFAVDEVVEAPLKEFDQIRDKARDDYFAAKADERAEEIESAFEAALDRLGREARQEQVAAIESKRDERVEAAMTEWRTAAEAKRDEARATLEPLRPGPARNAWAARLAELEAELAAADAKREELAKEIGEQIDGEVEEEVKKAYAEILAAAAAEAGIEVREIGPYSINLGRKGTRADRYDDAVKHLIYYGSAKDLEAGEATDLLDDPAARKKYLAVCKSREPATVEFITRRELLNARTWTARQRLMETFSGSFGIAALEKRYDYHAPRRDRPENRGTEPPAGDQ